MTKWQLPAVQLPAGEFLLIFASGKNHNVAGSELHTNFNIAKAGEYLALVAPDGSTVIAKFGSPTSPLPAQFEDISYGLMQTGNTKATVLIPSGTSAKALVPPDGSLGKTWTRVGFDDAAWDKVATGVGYDENSTYIPEFGAGGNLGNRLNNINTSLYLRVLFDLADASAISKLTLKMKYDDGFAAFLNGVRVAFSNSPASTTWNSKATGSHADGDATTFKAFNISAHAHLLDTGANVLAVQGLNTSMTSSDMLISPELHAVRITDPTIGGPGYLGTPSPGLSTATPSTALSVTQNSASIAVFLRPPLMSRSPRTPRMLRSDTPWTAQRPAGPEGKFTPVRLRSPAQPSSVPWPTDRVSSRPTSTPTPTCSQRM